MFVRLSPPEAGHARGRHTIGSVTLSITLHALIIWAVLGTAQEVATMPRRADPEPIIWDVQPTERRAEPSRASLPTGIPLPADRLFRRLALPPADIPDGIPPVTDEPFDPLAFGSDDRPLGGPHPGLGAGHSTLGAVFDPHLVDEPPVRIAGPPVRYPPLLRRAGLEGRATVEVVIDTLGHPEPATLKVVETTHTGFADEARSVVLRSVYRPGRVRGQAVRVRILQPVVFQLGP